MSQEIIVVAVHGMGDTKIDFYKGLQKKLSSELGSDWNRVLFSSVYYQDVLQDNQERVYKAMIKKELDWTRLRKFLLYGFSDAAGLERNSGAKDSPYHEAQKIIKKALIEAFNFAGGSKPVIIIAQSLGCQVMSNYIWDSQQNPPKQGVWKYDDQIDDAALKKFLKLKSMKYFYTTGCNIPIFVSGFPKDKIKAISSTANGYSFRWKNFYDQDDVLGWPLKPLSPSYRESVFKDIKVDSGGSLWGSITQAWNPLSHNKYWEDSEIVEPLANDIRALLS